MFIKWGKIVIHDGQSRASRHLPAKEIILHSPFVMPIDYPDFQGQPGFSFYRGSVLDV